MHLMASMNACLSLLLYESHSVRTRRLEHVAAAAAKFAVLKDGLFVSVSGEIVALASLNLAAATSRGTGSTALGVSAKMLMGRAGALVSLEFGFSCGFGSAETPATAARVAVKNEGRMIMV
jgi:hypothetical protein